MNAASVEARKSASGGQLSRRGGKVGAYYTRAEALESRYRRQGAVENLFFRYKRTLGNSLLGRGYESQKREARIGCNVLNRMAELGKPESQAIVGE